MANSFTLSGTLHDAQNNPIAGEFVRFRVTSVGSDIETSVVYPRGTIDFKSDANGVLQGESGSNEVWINGNSTTQAAIYEIRLNDGQVVDVLIPSDEEDNEVPLAYILSNYAIDPNAQPLDPPAEAKAYTDALAASPEAGNTAFNPTQWRTDLNVADGAQVNDPTTLLDADINSTVQPYNVNTAKYNDTTANFTGDLAGWRRERINYWRWTADQHHRRQFSRSRQCWRMGAGEWSYC